MSRPVKIPVIIPAYNEADSIPGLLAELRDALPGALPIVISDGSADDTARLAAASGATVLDLPCNLGVGGAVQAGFQYVVASGYDLAVRIDGDGQHPPAEIPKLLEKMRAANADAVVGSRYLAPEAAAPASAPASLQSPIPHSPFPIPHSPSPQSPVPSPQSPSKTVRGATAARDAGNIALALFLSLISRCRVTDPTSGFWCVRGDLLRYFARRYPSEYPEPEAIALLRRQGYAFAETRVEIRPRKNGVSTIDTSGMFYFALRVSLALAADRLRPVDRRFAKKPPPSPPSPPKKPCES